MEEQGTQKDLFRNFEVQRVKNGFILTMNKYQCMVSDEVYVFNTLEQLSDFIKKLDD
jgi:hypothetical protein